MAGGQNVGSLWWSTGIDFSGFNRDVKNASTNLSPLESQFNKITNAAAAYLSLNFAASIAKQIITVRGEFQQLAVAFETMLGSKEKADKLMADVTQLAASTPFTLQDVATSTKQLLAYGFSAEGITKELRMLGDVASGVNAPIKDLTYLYGTLKSSGRVTIIDLQQFAGRGIPVFDALSKTMGVAKEEIRGMVSAGKIGFPQVEAAFKSMTSEGGLFFNLMQKQSQTITGQLSNLTDKFQYMLNSIGQQNEGLIASGISGLSTLIDNYEAVLDVLKVLVVTYGAYKAAVMATAAAQAIMGFAENVQLVMMFRKELGLATAAQQAFNLAGKANPYGLILAGIAAVVTAFVVFSDKADEAAKAQKDLNDSMIDQKTKIDALVMTINSENAANADKAAALKELKSLNPEILGGLTAQNLATKEGKDLIDEYVKSLENKAKLEQLVAQKAENRKKQAEAGSKKVTAFAGVGMAMGGGADLAENRKQFQRNQAAEIAALKEQEALIDQQIETVLSGGKKQETQDKKVLTIAEQISEAKKNQLQAEKELEKMRGPGSTASLKQIKDQQELVDQYKDTLQTLTGLKTKEKKDQDEIAAIQEKMQKATGDELTKLANKLTLLEKEKAIREGIISSELELIQNKAIQAKGGGTVSEALKNVIEASGIKGVKSSGAVALSKEQAKQEFQGDKMHKKLLKQEKERADQEEEDGKRKAQLQEDLIDGAFELSNILMGQLDISKEQADLLQEQVGVMASLASGDWVGAALGAVSMITQALANGGGDDATLKSIEKINGLLEQQSKILANLAGEDYFTLAKKQYDDLGKAIDENFKKLKETTLLSDGQLTQLNTFNQRYVAAVASGNNSLAKTIQKEMTNFLDQINKTQAGWNLDDIIDAYKTGAIVLGESQAEWFNTILDAEKQRIALLQETFSKALGFDATTVADNIFNGIEEGLKLGETGLGGFAKSFGELMKTALMQSVIDGMNVRLTEGFLTDYKSFMEDNILSSEERAKLEKTFYDVVKQGQIDVQNIKEITDEYLKASNGAKTPLTTGIAAASEDTVALVAGQLMAIRNDIKTGQTIQQNFGINHLDLMAQSVGYLRQIEQNTKNNSILPDIKTELKEMNQILREKL